MKNRIFLVVGIVSFIIGLSSCLDEESETYTPPASESNNLNILRRDSIPSEENDSTELLDTGGTQGQTPVKP